MSARRKAATPKEDWQATRARYTWHLRPPFNDGFDHTHWWKGQSETEPGALYELARRHWLICAYRQGALNLPKTVKIHPIIFLGLHGLQSWPKLGLPLQEIWGMVAGNIKGVDCRDDSRKCFSIESESYGRIKFKRAFTTKKYQTKTVKEASCLIEGDIVKRPPSTLEIETEIKREAVAAYRNGYLLIAVATDLTADNAESLMAKEYSQHRKESWEHKQRARWENWLPLISEFEDAVISKHGVKSKLFTRYRRIIDGINFP